MFDMRCEEEAAVQPHSRARQEQLQLINSQLREEDDKWQDVSAGPRPWAVGRLRCPLGKRPFGTENQIGWEPRAGKPCRRKGGPEKTSNSEHRPCGN